MKFLSDLLHIVKYDGQYYDYDMITALFMAHL